MKSSKTLSSAIFLVVALVVIIGVTLFTSRSNNTPAKNNTETSTSTSEKTYTLAQVSTHSTGASCWTAINDEVYDVTSWISEHPGGSAAILSLCGKDGSVAFNGQHGGQARPASELSGFKIGTLTK